MDTAKNPWVAMSMATRPSALLPARQAPPWIQTTAGTGWALGCLGR